MRSIWYGVATAALVAGLTTGCGQSSQQAKAPSKGQISKSISNQNKKGATDNRDLQRPSTQGEDEADSPEAGDQKASVPTTPAASAEEADSAGDCYKGDPFICEVEQKIVTLTNKVRGQASPLKHAKNLSFVARLWSGSQAKAGTISHNGFPDQRFQAYKTEFKNVDVDIRAENVAMSYSGANQADAVAAMFTDMWAQSPGHLANMVGNFGVLGVGVFEDNGAFYATQIFGE